MVVKIFLFLAVATSFLLATPARDVEKFPCHAYLDIINDWPDGFRGMLELPVFQQMSPFPESMQDGHVILNFNRSLNALDIPEGDHSKRKVLKNNQEYHVFIKFVNQLTRLKKGDIFSLDISLHHQRWMKGRIGITGIQFGNFICPEPVDKEVTYPDCSKYIEMIDNSPPDGYRAAIKIPVNYTMNGWNMEVGFAKPILVLDVPQGVRTPAARNVKIFNIENREYNGFVKKDSTFRLEFMVHFDVNRLKKRDVKINYIRFGIFECRLPSFVPQEN